MAQTIEEHDEAALSFLEDITCDDNDDLTSFTITFKFAPNPYFTNAELKKTLQVSSLLSTSNIAIEKVRGGRRCPPRAGEGAPLSPPSPPPPACSPRARTSTGRRTRTSP